jgi:hypothetical protein
MFELRMIKSRAEAVLVALVPRLKSLLGQRSTHDLRSLALRWLERLRLLAIEESESAGLRLEAERLKGLGPILAAADLQRYSIQLAPLHRRHSRGRPDSRTRPSRDTCRRSSPCSTAIRSRRPFVVRSSWPSKLELAQVMRDAELGLEHPPP